MMGDIGTKAEQFKMELTGDLFPVAERVSSGQNQADRNYSISTNGVLVYLASGAGVGHQYRWFDRAGKEVGTVGRPAISLNNFGLSVDNRRLIVERLGSGDTSDLWISDLEHGTEGRFTFDTSRNAFPVWSPDGGRVAFRSNRGGGVFNLYQRASNGAGQDEPLLESKEVKMPWDWSRDGRFLVYGTLGIPAVDLWALPIMGDKKPELLLHSDFNKTQGQVSPDGRWLAYCSIESGRPEVYVVPFAPGSDKSIAGKWQVSIAGGTQPRWRGDGRELFYMGPDQKLMALDVKPSQSFERGTPEALFTSRSDYPANGAFLWGYAASTDGKRFLISTAAGERDEAPPLTVVVNWLVAVKK
jgi:eukaryotic-like serine/threonine-protein kinase